MKDYHSRIITVEDQKYDREMDVMRKDYEVCAKSAFYQTASE